MRELVKKTVSDMSGKISGQLKLDYNVIKESFTPEEWTSLLDGFLFIFFIYLFYFYFYF